MILKETKAKAKTVKKKDPVLKELSEKLVHLQVASFLNLQYPEIIFTSDASGLRVTMGLRQEIDRKSPNRWKVPDLIILEPRKGMHGLVLELKKKGTRIMNSKGEYASEHLQAQAKTLAELKSKGYWAAFACGTDRAIEIINDYLKP